MEPMYLSIQQKETGKQIRKLLMENGYTVKDVQRAMGFENPQAIYKWISGRSLPSLDNFVILSRLLHTSMEDILVRDIKKFEEALGKLKNKMILLGHVDYAGACDEVATMVEERLQNRLEKV